MNEIDDLWCSDCGKSHEGMCKKHGALHKVQDAVIPSRARLTLPPALTLKSVKENGVVYTGVFAKKLIPVRSQFGPLDAPLISRVKFETKNKTPATVWKKKNAVQKAMETSVVTPSGESADANNSSSDVQSPVIPHTRPTNSKGNNFYGVETAVEQSNIEQQLLSITSQSLNQSGMNDGSLLNLQSGLHHLPLQSSPVGGHSHYSQLQQSLQELPPITFSTAAGSLQLTHENLQAIAQHYHATYGQNELSAVHSNLNLSDFVSPNQLHHSLGSDQSASSLLLAPPLEGENQSAEDSGVADTPHANASDSIVSDVTSDTELDDSTDQDMTFELKIMAEEGYIEMYDTGDEEHSNWMIFVRPATTIKEQNLLAYEEDGQIYYVSLRPIHANTELKVWYSKDYAKSIKKGMLPNEPTTRQLEDNKLQCLLCEVKLSDQEEMDSHQCIGKIKGRRKGRPRKYVKPTKTWRAKMEKTKTKETKADGVSESSAEANSQVSVSTPQVKRGRGRPRIRPLVMKSENTKENADEITQSVPSLSVSSPPFTRVQQKRQMTQQQQQHLESQQQQQQQQYLQQDAVPQQSIYQQQQQHKHQTRHASEPVYNQNVTDSYDGMVEDDDDDDDNDDDDDEVHGEDNMADHLENLGHMNQAEDPLYEEKKLVITEDRPKRKRGPKSTKSPLRCPHCGENFHAEAAFYLHVYSHTGIKPFICEVAGCERGFLSKFKLERHRLIHTSPRHHMCLYCDKKFNRKDHLKNHMITHDPNKKIWKCDRCDKEYAYSFSYRTHMAFHAAESGETLTCGICKKECESKELLLFHLKVHTGARAAKNSTEKTHHCFECGKKFFTRKDVKRHMITHTKKKDFLCQYCPQRFGRKDHLTRHLRTTHTGDNPNVGRGRRSTGESSTPSPQKPRRERPIYTHMEPTMVPLQMAIPTMQTEDIQEQLISGVAAASQGGGLPMSQAALLQNLQYAVSQMPGQHGAARDIPIPAVLYEAAAAASAQQQQQQQQQQQPDHQQQIAQIAAASVNSLPSPVGMSTLHTSIPVQQYQVTDKGYILNAPHQEQNVRQVQLSPNVDFKQYAQQLNGNMYIAAAVSNATQLQHQQQQQQHQLQPIMLQQQQTSAGHHQNLLAQGKIEAIPLEITRLPASAMAALQQPPEYQIATAQPITSVVQSIATSVDADNKAQIFMTSPVVSSQNQHSQAYSTIYMETLRFLENLPTNNPSAIPVQQLQAINVDISQGQTAHLVPAAAYNTVSASNVLNINQAELVKGLVTVQHPQGGTLHLSQHDLKNAVSFSQTVPPVQHADLKKLEIANL